MSVRADAIVACLRSAEMAAGTHASSSTPFQSQPPESSARKYGTTSTATPARTHAAAMTCARANRVRRRLTATSIVSGSAACGRSVAYASEVRAADTASSTSCTASSAPRTRNRGSNRTERISGVMSRVKSSLRATAPTAAATYARREACTAKKE